MLCVQALGGLPEASPGKIVRVCRPGGAPQTIDLRALPAVGAAIDAADEWTTEDAAALNRAALDGGSDAAVARAAAAAAILLHAARGADPLAAAADARRALVSGEARAVAARLGSA